ncbi:MAG: ABC transporter permease subunit [Acidobacteriota bacterium]
MTQPAPRRDARTADRDRVARVAELHRQRPRDRLARASGLVLVLLVLLSWSSQELRSPDLLSERRVQNLQRFLGELRPYPLQVIDFDLATAWSWAVEILDERGWEAARRTLAMSVAAIVLAALAGLALTLTAARNFATPEPYLPAPRSPTHGRRWLWRGVVAASRLVQIFIRSLPEYVWAFIFLAVLGPTAWPVVLALALHNAGIVGKLTAEVVENLEPGPLRALRGVGAGRLQIAATGLFPIILPRFLLFFFYRWETCVREATVLGMLGISSLGFWIVDTRARNHYDEMFFFVLLGAGLVLIGDLVSAIARAVVRRAA